MEVKNMSRSGKHIAGYGIPLYTHQEFVARHGCDVLHLLRKYLVAQHEESGVQEDEDYDPESYEDALDPTHPDWGFDDHESGALMAWYVFDPHYHFRVWFLPSTGNWIMEEEMSEEQFEEAYS